MRPMRAIIGDLSPDAASRFRSCFEGVEIDAFMFQRPPETLNEDILFIQRLLPSMEISPPASIMTLVKGRLVH